MPRKQIADRGRLIRQAGRREITFDFLERDDVAIVDLGGDPSQVDLPRGVTSGLVEALSVLDGVNGVVTCRFRGVDVVRHPLVQRIVEAYDTKLYPKPDAEE